MNRIELLKSRTGWQARFLGPHSVAIIALFDTNEIPTPYTAQASAETVLAAVQAKNPGVPVTIAAQ